MAPKNRSGTSNITLGRMMIYMFICRSVCNILPVMAEKGERQEEEGASSLAIEHEDEGVDAMVEGRLGYHEHAGVHELYRDGNSIGLLAAVVHSGRKISVRFEMLVVTTK